MSRFNRPPPPRVFQLGDLVSPAATDSKGNGIARGKDGKFHPDQQSFTLPQNVTGIVGAAHYSFIAANGGKKVVLDRYLVMFGGDTYFVRPDDLVKSNSTRKV